MPGYHVVRLGQAAMIWADHALERSVARELLDTLDILLTEAATPLVIDLVRVPSVDPEVVAVLATAVTTAASAGGKLELRLAGDRRFTVRDAAQLRHALTLAYPKAA
ncbi:MAG: STAS domain-containing protein [Actinoplanes sp.]